MAGIVCQLLLTYLGANFYFMRKHFFLAVIGLLLTGTVLAQGATYYYNEGIKLKDDKKYKEALTSFKKASSLNPKYKEAFYEAGWCSNELEQYDEALTLLNKANALWPNQAKIYFEMGYANEQLDNYEQAAEQFKKAISLYEDYPLAYKELGNVYFFQKEFKKALDFYQSYADKEPNIKSATYYYRRGYCENDLDKIDDAITSLEKAIELDPEYTKAYTELGYAYYTKENYSQALTELNTGLGIEKTQLALYYKGLVYVAQSKKSDAMDIYRQLQDMKSDYAEKLKKKIDLL